jgi:hypothetical protein
LPIKTLSDKEYATDVIENNIKIPRILVKLILLIAINCKIKEIDEETFKTNLYNCNIYLYYWYWYWSNFIKK